MNPMNFIMNYLIAKNRAEHYNVADVQKVLNTALMSSMIVDNPMMNYLLIESQAKNAAVATPATSAVYPVETKLHAAQQEAKVIKAEIKSLELTAANKEFTVFVDVKAEEQSVKNPDTKTGETKGEKIEENANGKNLEKDLVEHDKSLGESAKDTTAEKTSDTPESDRKILEDLVAKILKISKSLETIEQEISHNKIDILSVQEKIVSKNEIANVVTESFNKFDGTIKSLENQIKNLSEVKNPNLKQSK